MGSAAAVEPSLPFCGEFLFLSHLGAWKRDRSFPIPTERSHAFTGSAEAGGPRVSGTRVAAGSAVRGSPAPAAPLGVGELVRKGQKAATGIASCRGNSVLLRNGKKTSGNCRTRVGIVGHEAGGSFGGVALGNRSRKVLGGGNFGGVFHARGHAWERRAQSPAWSFALGTRSYRGAEADRGQPGRSLSPQQPNILK